MMWASGLGRAGPAWLGRHSHLTNGSLARCGGFGQPEIPHMCSAPISK